MKRILRSLSSAKGIILSLSLLYQLPAADAQTSIFQDAQGEAAYKISGSSVTINPTDANISAAVDVYYKAVAGTLNKFKRLGINAKVSANEGIANLKNSKGFLIDGEVGVFHEWKSTTPLPLGGAASPSHIWTKSFFVTANLLIDRNKLYNVNSLSVDNVYSKGYAGWKVETGMYGFRDNLLMGLSFSGGQKTNIDYLESATIASLQAKSANDSNFVWKEETAYDSASLKGGLGYMNGNLDIGYLLNQPATANGAAPVFIAINLRYKIMQGERPLLNPGIGIFLGESGAPQTVAVGLSLQLNDAFDVLDKGISAWKRTSLNLTAGFKFGN